MREYKMKIETLEKQINKRLPSKYRITLVIMPDSDKDGFWAYHNTSIQKSNEDIISLNSVISLNLKNVDDEKIYKELYHEISHLNDYVRNGVFVDVLRYLDNCWKRSS